MNDFTTAANLATVAGVAFSCTATCVGTLWATVIRPARRESKTMRAEIARMREEKLSERVHAVETLYLEEKRANGESQRRLLDDFASLKHVLEHRFAEAELRAEATREKVAIEHREVVAALYELKGQHQAGMQLLAGMATNAQDKLFDLAGVAGHASARRDRG